MNAHESFLLAEAKERVAEGERRARLGWGLGELERPTLRERSALTLVALAHRLSPEVALSPQRSSDAP